MQHFQASTLTLDVKRKQAFQMDKLHVFFSLRLRRILREL